MRLPLPLATVSVALLLLPPIFASRITPAVTVLRTIRPYAHAKRSPTTIKGLLQIREAAGCDPGFHACVAFACCRNDQNCVLDGCCPIGSICSGVGDQCTDPSLVLCPDKSGCCAADETCVKDDSGMTACGGGGGGGVGGGAITTQRPPTTTSFSDLSPSITPFPSQITVGSSPAASSLSAQPTPLAGEIPLRYVATDSRITWSTGWTTTSSTCAKNGRKTSTFGDSFTLMLPSANSIYLNMDRSAGVTYQVFVNNWASLGSPPPILNDVETCAYNRVAVATAAFHINLTVVVWGVVRSGRRQLDSWTFQLNEVLVMHLDNSDDLPTGSDTGGAQQSRASWFGLGATLLAGLGLAF